MSTNKDKTRVTAQRERSHKTEWPIVLHFQYFNTTSQRNLLIGSIKILIILRIYEIIFT